MQSYSTSVNRWEKSKHRITAIKNRELLINSTKEGGMRPIKADTAIDDSKKLLISSIEKGSSCPAKVANFAKQLHRLGVGLDFKIVDCQGDSFSVLGFAIYNRCNLDIIKALVENGADIGAKSSNGADALSIALASLIVEEDKSEYDIAESMHDITKYLADLSNVNISDLYKEIDWKNNIGEVAQSQPTRVNHARVTTVPFFIDDILSAENCANKEEAMRSSSYV